MSSLFVFHMIELSLQVRLKVTEYLTNNTGGRFEVLKQIVKLMSVKIDKNGLGNEEVGKRIQDNPFVKKRKKRLGRTLLYTFQKEN